MSRHPNAVEQLLADAADRAQRMPQDRVALVLRLGALDPPAKPHQARIARVLLQEAAERHAGQVFPLGNGDLVLLCRASSVAGRSSDPAVNPAGDVLAGLLATLSRLFGAIADPAHLLSLWPLAESAAPFLTYAAARLHDRGVQTGARRREPIPELARSSVDPALTQACPEEVRGLAIRETAVILDEAREEQTLRPLYREIRFAPATLAQCFGGYDASGRDSPGYDMSRYGGAADADLLCHLRHALERRLLGAVLEELPSSGPLGMDGVGAGSGIALALALGPRTVLDPRFRSLAGLARDRGVPLAVTIALEEVMVEGAAFVAARGLLRCLGVGLALGGVSMRALTLARPEALGADFMQLEWSERLAEPHAGRAVGMRPGATAGMVLAGATSERAVLWGLGHGIRRFQGPYVEAMLAAQRMAICPMADGCTLRQCIERATTTAAHARRFCRNLPLLDAAAPTEQPGLHARELALSRPSEAA